MPKNDVEIQHMNINPRHITLSYWGLNTNYLREMEVSPKLRRVIIDYQNFFKNRNQYKKAIPINGMSKVVVSCEYPNDVRYDFVMNFLQDSVFQQFMGHVNKMTFEQIQTNTNLPEIFLKKILHSLCCNPNVPILIKESDEKNIISNTDSFYFNLEFAPKKKVTRIEVPCPPLEDKHNKKKVVDNHSEKIQACISRIMKTNKNMKYVDLKNAVFTNLIIRENIDENMIKLAINKLIDNDILERDINDSSLYKYIE